jgi:hypothetical protein
MSGRVASLSVSMIAALTASLCALTISLSNSRSARAAGACVTAPKPAAPEGRHWRYRTDRALQRKCWYLASEGHNDRSAARTTEPPSEPQLRTAAPPIVKEIAVRLTQPPETASPAPSAEQSAGLSGNANVVPAQAPDPALAAAEKDQPKDQQPDQPTAASDRQRVQAAWDQATIAQAPMQMQQTTQPAASSADTAIKNTADPDADNMRMLPFAIGALAAAGFLAGAILYASGAKRRQRTIVRIVDLNGNAPRRPSAIDPGSSLTSSDVRHDDEDEHGGVRSGRRGSPPWRRQAA